MLFIALLLRAWLVQMKSFNVTARALADDLLVFATGFQALNRFTLAFQATLQHMVGLGGRTSAPQNRLFASFAKHRTWLSRHLWPTIDVQVPVVARMGDLGTELVITNKLSAKVSKSRLLRASHTLWKIARLPLDLHRKSLFIQQCAQQRFLWLRSCTHPRGRHRRVYITVSSLPFAIYTHAL